MMYCIWTLQSHHSLPITLRTSLTTHHSPLHTRHSSFISADDRIPVSNPALSLFVDKVWTSEIYQDILYSIIYTLRVHLNWYRLFSIIIDNICLQQWQSYNVKQLWHRNKWKLFWLDDIIALSNCSNRWRESPILHICTVNWSISSVHSYCILEILQKIPMWVNCSGRSWQKSNCARIDQVTHQKWATLSDSLRSLTPKMSDCELIAQAAHQN